jgi:hypothetical protein
MIVTVDLALHLIFFPVELGLLAARNVTTVNARVSLFLPANSLIFSSQLL